MKKILILAAAAALLGSCAKNKYVVEGEVEGLAGTVYMYDEANNVVDSTVVDNGAFLLSGTVDTVGVRYLADAKVGMPATFSTMLILEPGTIIIASDPQNPAKRVATGTISNDARKSYYEQSEALTKEFRSEATTNERREAIDSEYEQLTEKALEANRDNYFGAMLLARQLSYQLSGQELLDQIAKFSPSLQATPLLTNLKATAEQKILTEPGKRYIDITMPNAAGEPVSLKSVIENPANKYTLLDFWASWCGPCMAEVPVLLKTYGEFHDKGFEIYGVSFDQKREDWLAAIDVNKMNWIHVSELNGFNNQAAKDYAVMSIPTNYLIDAQGSIVAKNLRGEELYEKISALLAE